MKNNARSAGLNAIPPLHGPGLPCRDGSITIYLYHDLYLPHAQFHLSPACASQKTLTRNAILSTFMPTKKTTHDIHIVLLFYTTMHVVICRNG